MSEDTNKTVRVVVAVLFLLALAAAAVLRLYDLDLKPLHSDEGVNGFFLLRLVTRGYYRYDPTNYHGPFLYYLIAPLLFVQKQILHTRATVFALRVMPALFGIGCVAVLWPMRRLLGRVAVVVLAVALAFEPGMVYFSRTTIHEIFLIFFTILTVYGFGMFAIRRGEWLGTDNRQPGRLSARFWQAPTGFIVAGMLGLAGCYANKETAIITYGAFGVGAFAAWAFGPGGGGARARWQRVWEIVREELDGPRSPWAGPAPQTGPSGPVSLACLVAVAVIAPFLVVLGTQVVFMGTQVTDAWSVYGFWAGAEPSAALLLGAKILAGVTVVTTVVLCALLIPMFVPPVRAWWRQLPVRKRRWLVAFGISGFFLVLLFGSLFNNPRGLWDMFATHFTWIQRGVAAEHTGHEKPFPYYLDLLWETDAPVLYVGAVAAGLVVLVRRDLIGILVGGGLAVGTWFGYQWASAHALADMAWASSSPEFVQKLVLDDFASKLLVGGWTLAALVIARHRRIGLFLAGWAGSITLVYCLVSYKTPWLVLNLTLPLFFVTAYFVDDFASELAKLVRMPAARAAVAVASLAMVVLPNPAGRVLARAGLKADDASREWVPWVRLTHHMNFVGYDDDRYELIYVQTMRDIWPLVDRLRALLAHDQDEPRKERSNVAIISNDYWPLPYYLNDFKGRLGYHSGKVPDEMQDIVLIRSNQRRTVEDRVAGWRSEQYVLRPGVVLILYVRPEVWDPLFGVPEEVKTSYETPPDENEVEPGVTARYFDGLRCDGEPIDQRVDDVPWVSPDREAREFSSPFCAEWDGWLRIEEEADYFFATESDDGSWLYLDGALAVDNGGTHGKHRVTSEAVHLEPGFHHLRVRYFDAGGGAELTVKWRPDFHLVGRPIQPDVLFHVPPVESASRVP